jgi:hypothetical protein
MKFAKIIDDTITQYPVTFKEIQKEFPSVSFPEEPTDSDLLFFGYVIVHETFKPADTLFQKAVETTPLLINNRWIQTYQFIDLSDEEKDESYSILTQDNRDTRNRLLFESDWTQLADSPVDKEIWAKYRQQLRDITAQPHFPLEIVWPDKPSK